MKFLNLLMWVGQFGFSIIFPLLFFLYLAVWLQAKFALGMWIIILFGILGLLTTVSTVKSCIHALCNVTLSVLSRDGVYLSTPRCWAGLVICFIPQKEAGRKPHQFWTYDPGVLSPSLRTELGSGIWNGLVYWEMRGSWKRTEMLQPRAINNLYVNWCVYKREFSPAEPAQIADPHNHELNKQLLF